MEQLSWRHIVLNMKSTWLPGDPRGFHTRRHRQHSSGDYRSPPPPHEHAGLRDHAIQAAQQPVQLTPAQQSSLGHALLVQLKQHVSNVLALSISTEHAHGLIQILDDLRVVKHLIGQCKGAASFALREELPGSIWAEGGTYKRIRDRSHHRNAFHYILYEQGPSAWTWSFKDKDDNGMFNRSEPT